MPSASLLRTRFSPATFSSALVITSSATAAGITTTPSKSASSRSPCSTRTPALDRAAHALDVDPPQRVVGVDARNEGGELHLDQLQRVAGKAVDHDAARAPVARRGGEQLAPVRPLHGRDDHDVALAERVDGLQLAAVVVVRI